MLPLAGLGCAPAANSADTGTADGTTADSGPGDSALALDSAPPLAPGTCMTGMVPVPPETPLYCIDAYEVSAGTASVAGAIPDTAVTFYEARAACESVPVADEVGVVLGFKRLATDAEWEDAADGTLGEGGWPYPYGEEVVEGACILPDATNTPIYDGLQLTGSAPACVSTFGAYDQVGNAWEWVDPGQASDSAAWLAAAAADGRDLRVGDDDRLYSHDGDLSWMSYEGVIVGGYVPYAGEDGALSLDASSVDLPADAYLSGYLESSGGTVMVETLLPVTLVDLGDLQLALHLDRARDGEPFTSKRGCAYYTGTADMCTTQAVSHEHPPDFDGTIGYRCASDPIPVAD